MFRLKTYLFASLPSLIASAALAQATATLGPGPAAVSGLAMNDLLNVRAEASAIGKTLTRLPNGSLVNLFECKMFNGYEWCRLNVADDPSITGWAPARYLLPLDLTESERAAIAAAQDPSAGEAAAATPPATPSGDTLPPGIEERFASEPYRPEGWSEQEVAKLQELASRLRPAQAADLAPTVPLPERVAAVPRPNPRAEVNGGATAAAVPTEVPTEVPCARYLGQPMQRCSFTVAKIDDKNADVAVFWPDGGFRLIEFREGKPASSNSGESIRVTREGTLNMIRVGKAERFEILDIVPYGG